MKGPSWYRITVYALVPFFVLILNEARNFVIIK